MRFRRHSQRLDFLLDHLQNGQLLNIVKIYHKKNVSNRIGYTILNSFYLHYESRYTSYMLFAQR